MRQKDYGEQIKRFGLLQSYINKLTAGININLFYFLSGISTIFSI